MADLDIEIEIEDNAEDQEDQLEEAEVTIRRSSAMSLANIAEDLDESELMQIANKVYEDFEADDDSRARWMQMHAEWKRLYHQLSFSDSNPYEWASKESVPILTEACNQFQSRAYKAFFPSRNFISATPLDIRDSETLKSAERVGKHMSYQLSVVDKSYKPDKNAMFLAAALHGSDFSKTYFDPLKGRNVVERVRAVDFVVPYGVGPRRLEDIERKTHVLYKSVNDTIILAKNGYFLEPAVAMPYAQMGEDTTSEYQEVEDEATGHDEAQAYHAPHIAMILEHHCLLDLDNDGIAEPYIVWLDKTTKKILRIQIRYEVDENGEGLNDKKPIEYFTHYSYLTNPDGFYGLGQGHLVGKLNMGLNKVFRQIIDAGTLANVGNMGGIVGEQLGLKGGELRAEIGKFVKMPRGVEDIRKQVFQWQFPGANPGYVKTMEFLQGISQRVSSTTEAVTGDIQKVMQPLTIMTLLESSLQMPTAVMEQMALSFEDELQKLYRLNQKYITKRGYFMEDKEKVMISPADYDEDLRIVPVLDPREITKQQKIAKAQELYQFTLNNPILAQNPEAVEEASRRVLLALDVDNLDEIMPEKKEVVRVDDQNIENEVLMLPRDKRPYEVDVYEDQDHDDHIAKIDLLLSILDENMAHNSPQDLDPQTLQAVQGINAAMKEEIIAELMEHRRKHVAYQYKGNIGGQGFNRGLEAQPGNAMVLEGIGGGIPAGGALEGLQAGGLEALSGTEPGLGVPAPADQRPIGPGILNIPPINTEQ